MLPFAAMTARSEAPAALHNAAATPTPLALLGQAIDEVRSRKRLVRYLVQAEMKKRGSDTILGNVWWVLDPLLQMVVYVVLVAIIARGAGIEDYALFVFSAILPWKWFSAVVGDATTSVVSRDRLIKQIAFPKIVLPVATTTAGVVGFAWGIIPLLLVMLLSIERISPQLLWIPVIAVVQYVLTLGVAILVSAANVFFRDLGNVTRHFLRLWWYLSPGLYSLDHLDGVGLFTQYPILRTLVQLNPFAVLFEAYRSVIYGTSDGGLPVAPNLVALAALLLVSFALLALATILFKRLEPNFAKVL
jgi:ABC-2 type transport system permease protein